MKDRLTADVELTRRMQASLTGANMASLVTAMDSVQGLRDALFAPLPEGRTRYDLIHDYLHARRGTGPEDVAAREARMRVLAHADIGGIIAGLPAEQHQNILRLATRGTLDPDPIDAVYDAARGTGTAEAALRGLMQMRNNRQRLDELQANPLFRDAIQRLQTPASVDGLTCSPFDYMMRLWGLDPRETGDPAVARAREVDPNSGDVQPLSPSDWREIDELFSTTVEQLGNKLARPRVLLFTDSWTSDSDVVNILTTFENSCAREPMRGKLQRGHITPGQELTRRANADPRIGDIRERLHRCVGEDARQISERVLSIRFDAAAVGQIGGSFRTAQDGVGMADGTGRVPIEQALRSIMLDGATLTQRIRETAVVIAESLATHWYRATRRDPTEILRAWRSYKARFETKRQELHQLTGIAEEDLHPIEFLVNIFREVPEGGDLATRITNCVVEDRVQEVLREFGLTPAQVSARSVRHGAPPPEATPAERFGPAATQLWQAIRACNVPFDNVTPYSPAPLENVATKFAAGMQTAGPPGGAARVPTQPRMVAGPLPGEVMPARVDGAADQPTTFAAYYRATYGIDPDRHVIELGRSFIAAAARKHHEILHPRGVHGGTRPPTQQEQAAAETWNLTPQQIATPLRVDAAQFSAAVAAPAERAQITDANRAELPVGYTERDAEAAATRIWELLRGRGDVVLIRNEINGKRSEEVRLINIEFRRLSGGIDLAFYLRQAADRGYGLRVGGDGVRAEGQAAAQTAPHVFGDVGSMLETADLAQTNRVGILIRMRNAIARSDRNELYRVVGDATPAEKRQILSDAATMDSLRQHLSEVEFDRVFADLNGTLDLAGMLWSRSSEASTWGTTDVEGMRADIREYMRRRREFHTQQLEQAGGEVDQQEVERRVREDALRAYSNPSVRMVIETECRSLFLSGPNSDGHSLTGTIINAGTDPQTGALTGNNWANVSELLTGIRAMDPAARARWRNDPEFWLRVDALSPSPSQRRDIVAALNGTETSGNDHIGIIRTHLDGGGTTEIAEALAHLSTEEIRRLQADPALVAHLQSRFGHDERIRGVLTTLLGMRQGADAASALGAQQRRDANGQPMVDANGQPIYELPNIEGTLPAAEIQRLEGLKTSAIARMRYGTQRSWEQLLREAVEVYRMDFRPQITATPPARDASSPPPAAPDRSAQTRRREQVDARATRYRQSVWDEVKDLIRTQADDRTKHRTIEQAVMGQQDPSETLMRLFLGAIDSESDIEATIRGASPRLIADQWSSIRHPKYEGTDGFDASYQTVYQRYKERRDRQARAAAGGTSSETAAAARQASAELETARLEFQRYRIEPSVEFERLLLAHAGNEVLDVFGTPEARQPRTTRDQELQRDNPEWHRWRDLLLERIGTLSVDEKLRALGAEDDPDARAIVGSRLASAEQSFQRAQEDHAFQRGDGYSFFGDEHGRELDRAFGDYGTALGQGEDSVRRAQAQTGQTQDITGEQARALGRYDERYTERSAEYNQARQEAAHWAGLVVAAVIGAAVTALTAGAGSVVMVAMYGALTGAAAATGDTLTQEMILGRTYDASGEGLRNIAQGAVTGMVAAGSQYYAGQIIRSLSGVAPSGTALQQAQRVAGVAEQTAPTWRSMMQQAGRAGVTAGVQTGLTGFANAAGTVLSPDIWIHGWDEGWVRAQQRIGAELRAIPLNVLRTTVSTMLANIRAPGPQAASHAAVEAGQRIGPERVLAEIWSQLPTNLRQGAIDAALQGRTTPRALAAGAVETELAAIRDVGQGLHDGSATQARAVRFAQREILAHGDQFVNRAEAEHYIRTVIDGHEVSAREFLAARDAVARAYMNGRGQQLTEAQQRAFLRWCREAPSPEEYRERMRTDPLDVEAVRSAGTSPPAGEAQPQTGTTTSSTTTSSTTAGGEPASSDMQSPAGQARTHATAARDAAEHARGAAEAALRAEDAYHQNRSAESGQRAIAEITAARTRAAEQVAAARRAVEALRGMLTGVAAEHRAAIEAELARAIEAQTTAETQATLVELTLRMVREEVNPTATQRAHDAPTQQPTAGGDAPPPREQMPRAQDMTPEQWMLLQHLIRQHGEERGLHEWRNLQQGRTADGTDINATIVPGSGFIGTGRPTPEPAAVLGTANREFPSLAGLFAGQIANIASAGRNAYTVTMTDGTTFKVVLQTTQLPYVQVARSKVNTQRGEHTVFLSERVADAEIRRALAHEVGEILAETRNARAGGVPPRRDVLGTTEFVPGPLSAHDWGRAAELNHLAAELATPGIDAASQARLRREVGALINALGLRAGTPGAEQRRQQLATEGALSPEATRLMFDPNAGLARPVDALPQSDRDALAEVERTRLARDEAELQRHEQRQARDRERLTPSPDQLAGGRVPPAVQEQIARDAAEARARKSAETIAWLRALHDQRPPGTAFAEIPNHVWIGGGGAVTGLTPETLFIDARGRWHQDQSPELAQTAQQVQGVHEAGMGDPHQFGAPDARVPMSAIRAFEDHLAAQARVVNGTASIDVGPDGKMRLTITPAEGDRTPITVVIGGHVTMSTGVPRERVAGETFNQPPQQSVRILRERLTALGHDPNVVLGSHTGQTDADAAAVARLVREAQARGEPWAVALAADADAREPLRSLGAVETFEGARAADAASGQTRILRGDEACRTSDFTTNPVREWVIAGTGGVAISAAEVILLQTRIPPRDPALGTVTVRMMGRDSAEGLRDNTQWQAIESQFGPAGENRLHIETVRHVDGLQTGPGGEVTGLQVRTTDTSPQRAQSAQGVVVALGSRGLMPPVIESYVLRAHQDQAAGVPGVHVHARLLWGRDTAPVTGGTTPPEHSPGKYLGYRILVTRDGHTQTFDVTGAQSRVLPPELFPDRALQTMVNRAGEFDAPSTSGNFAPGLLATAEQADEYRGRLSDGTIYTMDEQGRWR